MFSSETGDADDTDTGSDWMATRPASRASALDRAGRAVRGIPDDHPRSDDRECRTALDPDRPALLAVQSGVGGQRLLDRVRRPAAARRPTRGPDRPQADLPRGLDGLHHGVCVVRRGRQPGSSDRRAVRAGNRRRDDLGSDPRDDRDDVPAGGGPGQGDRRVLVRRRGRRLDWAARRRCADSRAQLALDLLRERADRDRHGRLCDPFAAVRQGHRPRARC